MSKSMDEAKKKIAKAAVKGSTKKDNEKGDAPAHEKGESSGEKKSEGDAPFAKFKNLKK